MKPASFEYHAPTTVDEALALLQANGPDCRVLAGGQTLIPMMNFRLASPPVIVDLNRIPDLAYIKDHGDAVCIGAMTRQRTIEFSTVVADKLPRAHGSHQAGGSPADAFARNHRRFHRQCRPGGRTSDGAAGPRWRRGRARAQGPTHALPHPIFFRTP